MDTRVISQLNDVRPYIGAWDELAISGGLPFMAPGVLIPWFETVAPRGAELAIIATFSDEYLVGLAPCFIGMSRRGIRYCRPLGEGTFGQWQPLADAHVLEDVAVSMTTKLAGLRPHPAAIRLGGVADGTRWIELITKAWPGHRGLHQTLERTATRPAIHLGVTSFDDWFSDKSSNFRADMRRKKRKLSEEGGQIVLASSEAEAQLALHDFAVLHHSRWDSRGGSGVVDGAVEQMLRRICTQLDIPDRLRIWQMQLGDKTIGSAIFMEAGSEIGFWLIGHDDGYSHLSPGILLILAEIEYSFERGNMTLSLGTGDQDYKRRFSDASDTYQWWELIDRRWHLPRRPAELIPTSMRRSLVHVVKSRRA